MQKLDEVWAFVEMLGRLFVLVVALALLAPASLGTARLVADDPCAGNIVEGNTTSGTEDLLSLRFGCETITLDGSRIVAYEDPTAVRVPFLLGVAFIAFCVFGRRRLAKAPTAALAALVLVGLLCSSTGDTMLAVIGCALSAAGAVAWFRLRDDDPAIVVGTAVSIAAIAIALQADLPAWTMWTSGPIAALLIGQLTSRGKGTTQRRMTSPS